MRSTLLLLPVSFAVAVPLSARASLASDNPICSASYHKLCSSEYGVYEFLEDATPLYYVNNLKEVNNKALKCETPKDVLFCCTTLVSDDEKSSSAKGNNSTKPDDKQSSSTTIHSGDNKFVFYDPILPLGDANGCFPLTPLPEEVPTIKEDPVYEDPFKPSTEIDEDPSYTDPFRLSTEIDEDPSFTDPFKLLSEFPSISEAQDPIKLLKEQDPSNLLNIEPTIPDYVDPTFVDPVIFEPEIQPWWLGPSEVTLNSGVPTKDKVPAKQEEVPSQEQG